MGWRRRQQRWLPTVWWIWRWWRQRPVLNNSQIERKTYIMLISVSPFSFITAINSLCVTCVSLVDDLNLQLVYEFRFFSAYLFCVYTTSRILNLEFLHMSSSPTLRPEKPTIYRRARLGLILVYYKIRQ